MGKWALLLVFAVGCSQELGEPALLLGTGLGVFEPLEDGSEVPVAAGAQGGWHLWESLRVGGLRPRGVYVESRTRLVAGGGPEEVRRRDYDLERLEDPGDGPFTHELLGAPVVLTRAECLMGQEVILEVMVTDRGGRQVGDARTVIPVAGDDGGPDPTLCAP